MNFRHCKTCIFDIIANVFHCFLTREGWKNHLFLHFSKRAIHRLFDCEEGAYRNAKSQGLRALSRSV